MCPHRLGACEVQGLEACGHGRRLRPPLSAVHTISVVGHREPLRKLGSVGCGAPIRRGPQTLDCRGVGGSQKIRELSVVVHGWRGDGEKNLRMRVGGAIDRTCN